MSKNLLTELREKSENFDKLDEDAQEEALAESMMQLAELLPDPSNKQEYDEFISLMQNPPIEGETDEEIMQSYLKLAETNPKFFAQTLAFYTLVNDADTLGNLAKQYSSKSTKVEAISKDELAAIHNENEQQRIADIKKELASIPVDK